jgi:hypothetical protein
MSPDRVERLQRLEQENFERSTAATAGLHRLLAQAAASGFRPQPDGAELSRIGQRQAALAYQQLAEAGIRFVSRAMNLALEHRDEYLQGLLGPGHVLISSQPPVPLPSSGYDPIQWAAWYQLLAAWIAEQQARSATLQRILADETAAGRLGPRSVQSSAHAFLEARLESYLVELAGLSAEFVSEVLDVTSACVDTLTAAMTAEPAAEQIILDVRGPAAATVTAGLLIENAHHETASVTCLATPAGEFGLIASPVTMRLEAGQSEQLIVHVALPRAPSPGRTLAGWITIRGHGETDLVAEVRAQVGHLPPPDSAASR